MFHRAKVLEINPGRLRIGSIEMTSETFVGEFVKGHWEQVNIAANRRNAIPGPSASSISIRDRLRIGSIEMTSETFVGEFVKGHWEQVNIAANRRNAIPGPSASSISI